MNTVDRFVGAEIWSSLPAEQKDKIGAIVMEQLSAWFAQEQRPEDDMGDDPLQRAADAADFHLVNALREALVDAVPRNRLVDIESQPLLPSMLGPVCRECGCSQDDGCSVGCDWAEPDLCTACVSPETQQ